MARQKNYLREKAIEDACYAFWRFGYKALSIRAIEKTVGLGRFAIRTEFNGKEGLFIEALKVYRERGRQFVIAPIDRADNLAALKELLNANVTPCEGSRGHFGCFFVNTIVENAALNIAEAKKLTDGHFNDVREATAGLIERTKISGEVRNNVDGKAAGDFIVGALMAIGLLSRDAADVTAAKSYVETANATIDSWKK